MAKTKTKEPKIGLQTGRQSVAMTFGSARPKPAAPASYDTYRKMRRHPTIALARALSIAPILAAGWTVESDRDDLAEMPKLARLDEEEREGVIDDLEQFIADQFIPCRELFLEAALFGGCDFGYQGFEKVFENDGQYTRLTKLKPLLQDLTEILIEDNGDFAGFRQKKTDVPLENSLLIPFRVEGTDWHGTPLLENVRSTWEGWTKANDGAERYDAKVAGAHWVVYYPVGKTENEGGQIEDNDQIARRMLTALEASGSIAIPNDMSAFVNAQEAQGRSWKIELMADTGARQPTFINRLEYLDKLMVRGLLLPERAVMEGTYGTKAEAEVHVDLALTHADLTHQYVTRLVNWHAVDQVLALNHGDEFRGKVRLVAGPVVDAKAVFLREVYRAILANPSGFLEEYAAIDIAAMRELVGLPVAPDAETKAINMEQALPGMETGGPVAAAIRNIYAGMGLGE